MKSLFTVKFGLCGFGGESVIEYKWVTSELAKTHVGHCGGKVYTSDLKFDYYEFKSHQW